MQPIEMVPGQITLPMLEEIYRTSSPVALSLASRAGVEHAASLIDAAARGDDPVYGVNTGFGKLASVKVESKDTAKLQRNLILSHCCGVGSPISVRHTRLMMTLKLLSLGRGASGVRWELIELIQEMLKRGVIPVVPEKGSVGASGDLAPLAHMTAPMLGEGFATYENEILPGAVALKRAGLPSIELGPKEGLAMINGTQFSTTFALAGLFDGWRLAQTSLLSSAITTDAIMGSTAPLQREIHSLRGHRGQIEAAETISQLLDGSEIRESHLEGDLRVQDPYCIRCQPQVTGAAIDVLRSAARTLEIEANAATDNPLVLVESGQIVSGGNFHAEPVGFAADMIALALSEIGAIAQRRVALMVDPVLSFGLPAFLTPVPGLNSGFMIAEVTTAALMSENKHLANPCVTDSTPTSANQEDHVSMAAHGARRLGPMVKNLGYIIGVEILCAAQGVELRAPLVSSPPVVKVIAEVRKKIECLAADRYLADDLEVAGELTQSGLLLEAANVTFPVLN